MEPITYARLAGDVVVVRVAGRGDHQNSLALRQVLDLTGEGPPCPRFIFDLEQCISMDSTFMGVLASLALRQIRSSGSKPIIVNANAHVREQLDLLGLKFILDIRDGAGGPGGLPPQAREAPFASVAPPEMGMIDRLVVMIEAHERLIDVDGQNEVRFRGVLQTLRESLERRREQSG